MMRQRRSLAQGQASRARRRWGLSLLGVELAVAVGLTLAGVVLLFVALCTPPEGQIDSSVLVAYGEMTTFAGGLFGIDYHRRRLFWVAMRERRWEADHKEEARGEPCKPAQDAEAEPAREGTQPPL